MRNFQRIIFLAVVVSIPLSTVVRAGDTWLAVHDPGIGDGYDTAQQLAHDAEGNVYVAGRLDDEEVLIKYDATGSEVWRRLPELPDWGYAFGLGVDEAGDVRLAQWLGGTTSVLVRKFDPAGEELWTVTHDLQPGIAMNIAHMAMGPDGTTTVVGTTFTPGGEGAGAKAIPDPCE